MSGYVADVRLAVKWLVSEAFSEEAARLLDGKTTLIAPELIFVETANALRAMCLRSDIASADFGFATSTSQLARAFTLTGAALSSWLNQSDWVDP